MSLAVAATAAAQQSGDCVAGEIVKPAMAETTSYPGYLNIEMLGNNLAQDAPATIQITVTGENTCTFMLPDFSLDLGNGPINVGDIIVPDVTTSEENGVTTYNGEAKGLMLAVGSVDVTVAGTIDASGEAYMDIDVMWLGNPINVTFSSKTSGINIVTDENAPLEYYNLNGTRVDASRLPAGIYIRRQGNKADKIIVR